MATQPYQLLYIDFGFSGRLYWDKDRNIIESSREDIEGVNSEISSVLVSNRNTRMLRGGCRLSKISPIE